MMRANHHSQPSLFPDCDLESAQGRTASTFLGNMKLPIHRWFRYSAGFSAQWVERVISESRQSGTVAVFDPFAGAATTLVAAEKWGVQAYGIEAHPFVARVAKAKLLYRSDSVAYLKRVREVKREAS